MSRNIPRYLLIFSLALNLGFLLLFLFQQFVGRPPFHPGPPRELAAQVIKDLDLTPEQEKAMNELEAAFDKQSHQMERTGGEERFEVLKLMAAPGPLNEEALRAQEQVLLEMVQKRFDMFLTHARDMEEIIGPDKRAQFHSILMEHIKKDHPEPFGGE